MAPKRKRSVATSGTPVKKRQLRSGPSIQPLDSSEVDTTASHRAHRAPSPRKATTTVIDVSNKEIEDIRDNLNTISQFGTATKAKQISQLDQGADDVRTLWDETNLAQKLDTSSQSGQLAADANSSSEISATHPNQSSEFQTNSINSRVAVRRQPTRGTVTVEVVINTTLKRCNRPSSSPRKSTSPHATVFYPELISNINEHGHPNVRPEASNALPEHLHSCFNDQKRAIMKSLQSSSQDPMDADSRSSVNDIAARQLADLLDGTGGRAEGNSCLLLGPRGSGKSRMIEICLERLSVEPIIIRLTGWVQTTDRHALREIAFQLFQQTGVSRLSDLEFSPSSQALDRDQEDENPFIDVQHDSSGDFPVSLPPSCHLHALIPALLTLKRPVVVILDAFDLFALQPRQSLLYCLLDTVQNCRASSENRGIAVIGVTSRVDAIQLLEKRVKSRFSGRIIRTAPPTNIQSCLTFISNILQPSILEGNTGHFAEWRQRWTSSVDQFLADEDVLNVIKETFSLSKGINLLNRILTSSVLRLSPHQPYLSYNLMVTAIESQRVRSGNYNLLTFSYPSTCLLIASVHINTCGNSSFTFEMLFDTFRDQVRASMSAPVQVNGGSIGMVRCTREVLMSSFECLMAAKIFAHVTGPFPNGSKEFSKHRCVLDREVVRKIVEKSGQVNLKKWFSKA